MKAFKIAKVLLITVLVAAMALTASAAFEKTKTYSGSFTDVSESAWYAKEVAAAYELGFIDGMSDTSFSPDTTVTVAQGITMACRVHAAYNNKTVATVEGGQWYDAYVNYAKENGIIDNNQFDSYTRELKRYEMAELFYDAMPKGYFNAINDVSFIPDVPMGAMYQDKLLELYNAGIVMGSDEYGTFNPENSIKRSECAAIINRVAIPENRVKGELADFTSDNAYTLCYNESMDGYKEGINSGWVLDNRGGTAKLDNSAFGSITDVSTKYGTAWIREFNYIPKGEIVLETRLNTISNGVYVEYLDAQDETTYIAKVIDGQWNIMGKDGKYTPVAPNNKVSVDNSVFLLRVSVNLNTGKSTTFINNEACGSFDLLSDNVLSFKIGIDEAGTGSISMTHVNMVVNYNVYEDFTFFGTEEAYGWKTEGEVKHGSSQLTLSENSSVTKSFEKAEGVVCTEAYFNSVNGKDFEVAIGDVLTIKAAGGKLYAGSKEIYTLTTNMWYRLRVEADTAKGTAKVYLNGMLKDEVNLDNKKAIETLKFSTQGTLLLDFIKVYELHEYDDYCPEPATKASMDDYIIGLNICSLWRNGTHFGWHCVTPFDEPRPVLGYYDEGLPETADWEIKFMVEHGIDFQAFCWYADVSTGPLKQPRNGEQLHNGFQYAKYSDYMKYCLLFEASNGSKFDSYQFRTHVVPYWFENYFLDDRYMTIDNMLVLPIFGATNLSSEQYFGSIAGVKAEFDYLEEVARSYGFDGVLYFACGVSSENLYKMGFDASYAYNWGTAGSALQVNIDKISASANVQSMYTIPTISVGFDSIPWHQKRYDLMTTEDYAAAMEWTKTKYLPEFAPKYDWADRFVWLSTWNEYGEGTYIMPAGLNGFGYLDVIREAFTDLPADHEDVVPTLKQLERINHLYPQYARLLRREGWHRFDKTQEEIEAAELDAKLYINDQDVYGASSHEVPAIEKDGAIYWPFEPITCMNYILNCHYEWRKDAGTLLIEANGHTVKYLVGSDRYLKDGVETDLGYVLETFDGIPRLDMKKFCEDVGYTYEEKDGNYYIYTDNYDDIWEDLAHRKTGAWEFNSFDTEGWSSSHMSLVTQDGALKMTTVAETRDPISNFRSSSFPEDFYTNKYTTLEIKLKYKYDGTSNQAMSFYYITDVDSSWAENKNLRLQYKSQDSKGEWEIYTLDLTTVTNWIIAERLVGLRFDPFNAHGEVEIDYIRFIEDPDFVYVPAAERPMDIINGDAEGTAVTFYSANASISRVKDTADKENNVWSVKAAAGKQWTYFRHSARYKSGSTYKFDFDIKLVGNNEADNPAYQSSSFCVNFRYSDKDALNKFDHIVPGLQNSKISVSDGWVHVSGEYTTENVETNEGAEFTIYVNPSDTAGYNYYIDNLVVREVGGDYEEEAEIKINENTSGSIVELKPSEETKPEAGAETGTQTPAVEVKPGVITENGDAEGVTNNFYSDNAIIEIVEDPDNKDNHVWKVSAKEGKRWTYLRYRYENIRAGVTYKMSYDIKYAGNNANDPSVTSTKSIPNFVYKQATAQNGMDHPIVDKAVKLSEDAGWIHVEATHTVESIDNNSLSCFAIYADPVGDVSFNYYIDNFVVEVMDVAK